MTEEKLGEGIRFGTAALQQGFRGIIREAAWQKGKDEYGGRTQLFVRIEPTSYDADEEHWPLAWYSYSESKNSVWGDLQARLEKLGVLPKNDDPSDLEGKEFDFIRKDIEFGEMVARNKILPDKFVKDHKKKTSSKAEAPAPSKAEGEEMDVDQLLIEVLRNAGGTMVDEKAISAVAKQGVKKTDAFQAVKKLGKAGVIDINADEGILVLKE